MVVAGTVGFFLNHLMDQVQQAIVDARNAGLNLEIEAGREVGLAVENAKNAFSQSLNESMDRIDSTMRKAMDQLSSMAQEVQERNEVALRTTTARVQQFINTLPFANLQPQVTDVTPRYIVPVPEDKKYNVSIKFFGNFMFAAHEAHQPELLVNGQNFVPSANTTQELDFSVPSTVLFPPGSTDPSKVSLVSAQLNIPWQRSEFWGMRHITEVDQYRIQMGALPSSPGQITFQYTTPRVVREQQKFIQGGFHLASTREAGNDDQKDVPFKVTPHTGWHVVRGSSRIEQFCGQGDYSYPHLISDDADAVVYQATTIHHGAGSSGSMDFSIAFDEYREVTVQDPHSENIVLNWGDSVAITQAVGRIIFQAFDGSHAEFAGADLSNRYIKIRDQGGTLIVSTADPSTLTLNFDSTNVAARSNLATLLRPRL